MAKKEKSEPVETITDEERAAIEGNTTFPVPHKAAGLPMMSDDRRGFEDEVDQSDVIIPRAKLIQPTCQELAELQKSHIYGGDIINSLTKEKLPGEFIPVFVYKEYIRFNGRKKEDPDFDPAFAPGALMWRTRDKNDPRVAQCKFGPNGEVPLGQEVMNFFCIFDGQSMPTILGFAKTSYKTGKHLYSLAKFAGGPMFSRKYKIRTTSTTNEQGTFFVMHVDPAGECDPETFKMAESYFNQFAVRREELKTHDENVAD